MLSEKSSSPFPLITIAVLKLFQCLKKKAVGNLHLNLMGVLLLSDGNKVVHLLKILHSSSCLLKLESFVLFKEKKNPNQDHFS